MANNIKPMARVPIVPSSYQNKGDHKLHELVMDYESNDLYVKDENGYINITGRIRDNIQEAIDSGVSIEIVTEDTIPSIDSRKKNTWYLVITDSELDDNLGTALVVDNYVYYGLIDDDYNSSRNYSLLSQNMIPSVFGKAEKLKILLSEGYNPCFYVPTNMRISCKYESNKAIEMNTMDVIYIFSPQYGTYRSYNMITPVDPEYNITNSKKYFEFSITVDGANTNDVSFEAINDDIGFKPIAPLSIEIGKLIPNLPTPVWEDRRYKFKGWSLKRTVFDQIDITEYKVVKPITLYAWFDYDAQGNRSTVNVISETE